MDKQRRGDCKLDRLVTVRTSWPLRSHRDQAEHGDQWDQGQREGKDVSQHLSLFVNERLNGA